MNAELVADPNGPADPGSPLGRLATEVRACTLCAAHLPLGPRPVIRVDARARVLIIGQAPGTRVHASGTPWDDPSGDRLRRWLDVDADAFYALDRFALMPMGFCYPGKGKGGDLPPRPECAPRWHAPLRAAMPNIRLTVLPGRHGQQHYLDTRAESLETTVRRYRDFLDRGFFPLPHPSPRNTRWLRDRPWFEAEVVPALQQAVAAALAD